MANTVTNMKHIGEIQSIEDLPVTKVGQHEPTPLQLWAQEQENPEEAIQQLFTNNPKYLHNKYNNEYDKKYRDIITQTKPNYNIQNIPFGEHIDEIYAIAKHWGISLSEDEKRQKRFIGAVGGFNHNSSLNGYVIDRISKKIAPWLVIAPNIIRERMLESVGPQIYMSERHVKRALAYSRNKHPKIRNDFDKTTLEEFTQTQKNKTFAQHILEGTILPHVYQQDTQLGTIPTTSEKATIIDFRGKPRLQINTDDENSKQYIGFNRMHI